LAGFGLVYGLIYAQAVLRGAGWMERIRQGNHPRWRWWIIALGRAVADPGSERRTDFG
jgi:hypothetical protein